MNERMIGVGSSIACHLVLLIGAAVYYTGQVSGAVARSQEAAPSQAAASGGSQTPPAPGEPRSPPRPEVVFQELAPALGQWPASSSRRAINKLVAMGADAVPVALEGLRHDNPKVRAASAVVLGRVGGAAEMPELRRVLVDRRAKAELKPVLDAMARIDREQTKSLALGLVVGPDPALRRVSAEMLAREVTKDDLPGLAQHLQDKDADVREKVFDLLKQGGDPDLTQHAFTLLGDFSPSLARKTLDVLVQSDDPAVTAALGKALEDSGDRATSYALLALSGKEDRGQRRALPASVAPTLKGDLRSSDPLVRVASCVAWLIIDYRGELAEADRQVTKEVAIPSLFELITSQHYFRDLPAVFPSASRAVRRSLGVDLGDSIPTWKSWWEAEGQHLSVLSELEEVDDRDAGRVKVVWRPAANPARRLPVVLAGEQLAMEGDLQSAAEQQFLCLRDADMVELLAELRAAGVFGAPIAREGRDDSSKVELRLKGGRRELAASSGEPTVLAIEEVLRAARLRYRWQLYGPAKRSFTSWLPSEYSWWAEAHSQDERDDRLVSLISARIATLPPERALVALADLASVREAAMRQRGILARQLLTLAGVQPSRNEVVEQVVDIVCQTHDPLFFNPMCEVLATTFGAEAEPLIGKCLVELKQVAVGLTHPSPTVRRLAVERAADEGPQVLPLLLDALGDADRRVRVASIQALGRIGNDQAREQVKVIALTGQGADRAAALKALGAIGGLDAQEVLLNAAQSGDRAVQVAAITGLSELSSDEAIEALMVQVRLEDAADSELRSAALEGLRRIGGPVVRAKVKSWLAQASGERTRADAAILLGHLLDMDAAGVLLELAKQPKWRTEAKGVLAKLFVADLGEDLFGYQVLRQEGRSFEELFLPAAGLDGDFTVGDLRGAGAKRDQIGPALVKLIADPRWFVREDADVLLRELALARPEPLPRDATVTQLKARQDYWNARLAAPASASR